MSIRKSKFLSLVLRHKPEVIGLTLDKNGWANVDELLRCLKTKHSDFTLAVLESIVASDEKKRYAFNHDRSKIRASQGHSINVDLGLSPKSPPPILYHGTAWDNIDSIMEKGLIKGRRDHVHLSQDDKTAIQVGKRHEKKSTKPAVLFIDAKKMSEDGHVFYFSENGVWLTDHVLPKYISVWGVLVEDIEIDSICKCDCHVKGQHVFHFAPCCLYSQTEYINPDGSIDLEAYARIVAFFEEGNYEGKEQ